MRTTLTRAAWALPMTVLTRSSRRGIARGRLARGVTMIEYVLLIAIAVVLAWLLRAQLTDLFSGILDNVRSALNTAG